VPKPILPVLASATMLATTLTALITGRIAKGKGVKVRNSLLVAGFMVLLAANALFAAPVAANLVGMFAACILVGIHMGMTHGLTLSMLSSYMPQDKIPGVRLEVLHVTQYYWPVGLQVGWQQIDDPLSSC
jgi:MFS family permease